MEPKDLKAKANEILDDAKNLEFDKAKELTVEEAVRQREDLQAGITEADDVLDKYIKKHRDEIGSEKYANKIEELDTKALDDFIQKQQAELAERKAALVGGAAAGTAAIGEAGEKLSSSLSAGKSKIEKSVATAKDKVTAGQEIVSSKVQEVSAELEQTTDKASSSAAAGVAAAGAGLAGVASASEKTVSSTATGTVEKGKNIASTKAEEVKTSATKATAGVAAAGAGLAAAASKAGQTVSSGTASVAGKSKEILSSEGLLADKTVLDDKSGKNKKKIIGGLGAVLLSILGLGYGLNYLNQSANNTTPSSAVTASSSSQSSSKATESSKESKELKAFNDLYKTFFADDLATKPKNSEFDRLPELEEALKALEGTSDYDAAKSKYDSLSKTIDAIKAINDKFETDAIVDGEKVEATLKEGATFDDLSSETLNTGKASLDTLIQAVIAEGRGLVEAGGGTLTAGISDSSSATGGAGAGGSDAASASGDGATAEASQAPGDAAASTTDQATGGAVADSVSADAGANTVATPAQESVQPAEVAPVNQEVAVAVETPVYTEPAPVQVVEVAPTPATTIDPATLPAGHIAAPTNYGYISYDPSTLQRNLSRVPFNFDLIADTTNPAWTFNPGVMEEIIRVSQERGYITGYNFILEPVNIVNGNGYYNMYKPDGTYLFTINAKTGYFVGNGQGYADALDY